MDTKIAIVLWSFLFFGAVILNILLARKGNYKAANYKEYWLKFNSSAEIQDYSEMIKYGREILYNWEITVTDLNVLVAELDKHQVVDLDWKISGKKLLTHEQNGWFSLKKIPFQFKPKRDFKFNKIYYFTPCINFLMIG